ncbi:hypothetical protein ACFVTC_08450 [Streptomyces sp. NPDC057950]|uniref:hypothetical protein n=1 Tax=Streptomyces sp. NPDC057950 TaxID=3346288 RepID=UPI0036E8BBF6
MSDHEYPRRQQRPGRGGPSQVPGSGAPAPRPPGKRGVGRVAVLGSLGALGLAVIIGIAGSAGGGGADGDDDGDSGASSSSSVHNEAKNEARNEARNDSRDGSGAGDAGPGSQAADFRSCVAKNGTATEKAAVRHITRVTGADERHNILDAPEVFTDFSGGISGPHRGEGELIASAFSSCYESDNGLVTVHDRTGEILAHGNF